MAWLDNIRNAMHPYDDDYIENEERAAEEELCLLYPSRCV